MSKFDLLICADVFKLDDLLWATDVKKVGISWTSDIVGLQEKHSINLRKIFELLIVDCSFSARQWQKLGVAENQIFQIPYGVDYKMTYDYNIKERKNVISTRSWQPNYNQEILLESILQTNNFNKENQFHFTGDGPTLEFLRNKFELLEKKESVKFLGYVPNEQIIDLISRYSVYISTSLSDGISVSMLEAMAAGTPVLVSDIEPNLEIIKHGHNGLLFKNNSIEDLTRVINDVFANQYDLKFISQNALKLIKEYANWEENMKKLLVEILNL